MFAKIARAVSMLYAPKISATSKNRKFAENLQNLWKGVYGQTTIQVRAHLYPVTGGVFEGLYFSQLFAIWVKNFPFSYLARHSIWRCLSCCWCGNLNLKIHIKNNVCHTFSSALKMWFNTRAVDRILKSRIKSDLRSRIKSDLFDFFTGRKPLLLWSF